MARREQYGLTWWGKEWLKALLACDHDNRLPVARPIAIRETSFKLILIPKLLPLKPLFRAALWLMRFVSSLNASVPTKWKNSLTIFELEAILLLGFSIMNFPANWRVFAVI